MSPVRETLNRNYPELCGSLALSVVLGPVTDHRVYLLTLKSPRVVPHKVRWRKNPRQLDEKACFIGLSSIPLTTAPGQAESCACCSPEHSTVMSSQGECRRHMNMPPATVMSDFRSDLDQTLDEPFH